MNRYEMESIMRSAYYTVIEMLGIDNDEPELILADTMKNKSVTGFYSKEKNVIVVKVREDIKSMIRTLCHELRHSWQHKRYKRYFERTYEELDTDDLDEYWECEFEVDARQYAEENYENVYNTTIENCSYLFD